jgi:hypothetical protein
LFEGKSRKIETLTTRKDGVGDFVDFGRGEDEDDMSRGLFEGLEESIPSPCREHVDFVDDIHFVCPEGWLESDGLAEFADIVDARV